VSEDTKWTFRLTDPEDAARDAFAELVWAAVDAYRDEYVAGLESEALQRRAETTLESLVIMTEDEPLPEQRPPGGTLFGLYEGVRRTASGADWAIVPARITIFRRPHEWAFPDPIARERAVVSTVRHELAHHLGTDEAGIRAIEAERRGQGGPHG